MGTQTLRIDSYSSPETQKFQWPIVGSLEYMRQWTFEQGTASLQDQAFRYGFQPEAPPLSPKSRLVHIAFGEPIASPTTILNRTPLYGDDDTHITSKHLDDFGRGTLHFETYSEPFFNKVLTNDELGDMSIGHDEGHSQKSSGASSSQCYSCGSRCQDIQSRPPLDESPHWFIDVHDGVRRKVAYVFCWKCVDVFITQLQRPPHPGCGHLPLLSLPSCEEECQLMFCGRCRVDINQP